MTFEKEILKSSKIVFMYSNSLARHFSPMFHTKCLLPRLDRLLTVRSCLKYFYHWIANRSHYNFIFSQFLLCFFHRKYDQRKKLTKKAKKKIFLLLEQANPILYLCNLIVGHKLQLCMLNIIVWKIVMINACTTYSMEQAWRMQCPKAFAKPHYGNGGASNVYLLASGA